MVEKKETKKKEATTAKKTQNKKTIKAPKNTSETNSSTKEKTVSIRGNIFEGIVTSAKSQKTITVERILTHYISKYERYKKVKSKVKAHVPEGMDIKEGDKVKIGETKRFSKTKNFIVIKKIGEEK